MSEERGQSQILEIPPRFGCDPGNYAKYFNFWWNAVRFTHALPQSGSGDTKGVEETEETFKDQIIKSS